jgi:hypothetical protein
MPKWHSNTLHSPKLMNVYAIESCDNQRFFVKQEKWEFNVKLMLKHLWWNFDVFGNLPIGL